MKNLLTETEKQRILKLYEQSEDKTPVVKLTPQTYKMLDPSIQKSVMDSIFNSQELVSKLKIDQNTKDQNLINLLNSKGVTPYIFNKYVHGTGEKFGMLGLYMDLYGQDVKLKLNINNVSEYMLESMPWALLSLNIPI